MTIKIETTETKTSEIVIGFPTFTKIVKQSTKSYYAILSEERVIYVTQYTNILDSINESCLIQQAFYEGFEMIGAIEFQTALNKSKNEIVDFTLNVVDDIQNLQFANLSVAERMSIPNNTITTDEDLQDKERAESVEYADIERESKEVEIN